ncbi:MAG: CoB--CoM heterodisulfide reductase iron-sulfur subunit B family protein [Acidobacteriota bacterium]|nr:CoB--CoM heterodisulfide reductase iron-sulfur subunit B family protein [Acidobacteriota bacterium]
MKYGYYPGCSLEKNASAYHESAMAVCGPLDIEFQTVDDWNCCGATEYFSIDLLPAYALVGRNLARAARNKESDQLVAPCSACFLNLKKTDRYMADSPELTDKVNQCLAAGGLNYQPGSLRIKHLLEVVVNDVGLKTVAEKVSRPLYGLQVAPYYGCMTVRPDLSGNFDNPEYPQSLDRLLRTIGADVVDFPLKAHCCGGHMTQISEETAVELIRGLLHNATSVGAEMLVTVCPMCQLNLDAYQEVVNKHFGTNYRIPVVYFTQLLGLAFGIPMEDLGFGKEFVRAEPVLRKIQTEAPKKPRMKRPSRQALPMPAMTEEV